MAPCGFPTIQVEYRPIVHLQSCSRKTGGLSCLCGLFPQSGKLVHFGYNGLLSHQYVVQERLGGVGLQHGFPLALTATFLKPVAHHNNGQLNVRFNHMIFYLAWTVFRKRLCDHSFCTYYVCMYVCTMSVCSMMQYFLQSWSLYLHTLMYSMGLGHNDLWFKFLKKKDHCMIIIIMPIEIYSNQGLSWCKWLLWCFTLAVQSRSLKLIIDSISCSACAPLTYSNTNRPVLATSERGQVQRDVFSPYW